MQKLISAGVYRLSRNMAFWFFAAFSAVCGALSAISTYINQPEMGQEYTIFGFSFFIPMFAAPFTAIILGTEFSDKTVRNKIIVGHTRAEVYFAYMTVSALASAAMCVLSAAVHFVVGLPLLGTLRISFAEFALLFSVGILSTLTMTVLAAMITLCTQSKALPAAVCAAAVIAMIVSGAEIELKLKESEYLSVSDLEFVEINENLPDLGDRLIPNPEYPTPEERKALEFLYDFLPGGAAVQSVWLEVERPLRVIGFEALWLAVPTAAGYIVFRRRNLK